MLTVDFGRLALRPRERLVDLGCGAGRHALEAARRGALVVAVDLDPAEVREARRRLAEPESGLGGPLASDSEGHVAAERVVALVGDVRRLPIADGSVDRVIASEVLEHVWEDDVAFGEIARILRPGGRVAVTVPRAGPEAVCWVLSRAYHSVPGGHIRIYRRRQLEARLERAGLQVEGIGYAHGLHSPYWWLRCLVGIDRDDHPLVAAYHRVLVRDLMEKPALTQWLDRFLNPVIGKSLVVYAVRGGAS